MKRWTVAVLAVCGLAVLLSVTTAAARRDREPTNLLDAMESGKVDAVFYGNGDQSVRGRVRRSPFGPEQIYVAPGTQFWAQQPRQGQDLQGMTTLGWVPIDLSHRSFAYVEIPTACTNYDLPAPGNHDRMYAVCCPDPRMAVLSEHIGRANPERPVAQLAVWAVANNPEWSEVAGWVEGHAVAQTREGRAGLVEQYRQRAADLLHTTGFDPNGFRMFR